MHSFGTPEYSVSIDRREQVIAIDTPPQDYAWFEERALEPALPRYDVERFVPAAVLAHKVKSVEDGILARIELLADEGAGRLRGKRELLTRVARELVEATHVTGDAIDAWFAACALRGARLPLDTARADRVDAFLAEFDADATRSKPLGFYTWTPAIEQIFRSDRALQTRIESADAIEGLAAVLRRDRNAYATYVAHLGLAERVTSPLSFADLRPLVDGREEKHERGVDRAIFPPSTSPETRLIRQLYGDRPIPDGFDLMREIVARVQRSEIDLRPSAASGFYDHQLFALEALLASDRVAEAPRLVTRPGYRAHLVELFRSLYALSRESHVKQLESFAAGAGAPREIRIQPELTVEPLATFYLRRALSVRFLRSVLDDAFGPNVLDRVARLTPTGEAGVSVADDLATLDTLLTGACATAWRELGGDDEWPRELGSAETVAQAAVSFAAFRTGITRDADVGADVRAMVPVFYDRGRRKTKVWAVLGWKRQTLVTEFVRQPKVTVVPVAPPSAYENRLQELLAKRAGKALAPAATANHPPVVFCEGAETAYSLAMVEAYVTTPMNRDEFRAYCDRYKTHRAIIDNLD